jgi:phosphoribosylformimino-5-aminoimidazole carboxamide ribotide isomerase
MIVIPAINAESTARPSAAGRPRLPPGDAHATAREYARCGFHRLHFDSGGERFPWSAHTAVLREILFDQQLDVQVHGGLTDADHVRDLLWLGARFAVIGCRGVADPDWLGEIAAVFPGEVLLNVEVSRRRVSAPAWMGSRSVDVFDLVDDIATADLAGLVLTDLSRRRGAVGPDLGLLEDLADLCDCPVYAAGGIATMEQLRALADRSVGGAVVGRAFAAGTLNPVAVADEFVS